MRELVNTHMLKEGDVIEYYGARMRLTNRQVWPMRAGDDPVKQGDCITFDGVIINEQYGAIPKGWCRDGIWRVQGNKLAHWSLVEE